MIAGRPKHRFVILDSLRGVCAIMVALFHFRANSHVDALPLVRDSWLFVDFFFVLSGFVIAANYQEKLTSGSVSSGRFMALRLARVYPLHVFMLVLFLLVEVMMAVLPIGHGMLGHDPFSGTRSLELIPENLLLMQSLAGPGIASWNVPSWSISAEVWTYLVFAGSMMFGRIGHAIFWALTLVLAPLMILIWHGSSMALEADGGMLRCLVGFGTGVMLWAIWKRDLVPARVMGWIEVPVMALVVIFVIFAPGLGLTMLGPIVFGLAVWTFTAERGVLSSLLAHRVFVTLGTLSYSIYMTQTFVHARMKNLATVVQAHMHTPLYANQVQQLFGTTKWMGDGFVVACCVVTVMVSTLTYRYVELPGQGLVRRRPIVQPEAL